MAVPQSRCPRLFADEEYEVDVVSTDLNCGLTGFLPLFEDPFQDARELSSPTCSFDDFLSAPPDTLKHPVMWLDEGEEVDSEEEAAAARTRRALPRVAAPKPLPVSDSEEEEDYFPTPKPAASSGRSGGAAGHSRPHSDDTWESAFFRFLAAFGTVPQLELSLDEAATRLNVERRRIYDIVNIFESLDMVLRKGKNKYVWLGTEKLPASLEQMRVRACAVRADRIARLGEDPHPDCCMTVDAPLLPLDREPQPQHESPARVTSDVAGDGFPVKLEMLMAPVVPSPVRTRRSPFRAAPSTPVRATAAELRRQAPRAASASAWDEKGSEVEEDEEPITPCTATAFTFANLCMEGGGLHSPITAPCPSPISQPAPKLHALLPKAPPASSGVIVAEDLACALPLKSSAPRRERSLGSLCQRFLTIFLLGRESFFLDEAARLLMPPEENVTGAAKFRTKIRRLYDIANVLTALGIVEKATALPQKKPYFRWLGPEAALVVLEKLKRRRAGASSVEPPVKRPA